MRHVVSVKFLAVRSISNLSCGAFRHSSAPQQTPQHSYPMEANKMERSAKAAMEKRGSPRNPAEIGIVCQPYSSSGNFRHAAGVLRNYSIGGMYIETNRGYKQGTILMIRTTCSAQPSSFLVCGEGLRTICLAEVKWHQDLADSRTARHGMGLRYLD